MRLWLPLLAFWIVPLSLAESVDAIDPASATTGATTGTGLTADIVFQVLAAELAGRRGDVETALRHYRAAAELTGDTRMAELAVRAAVSADDQTAIAETLAHWLALDPQASAPHQIAALTRLEAGDPDGALTHLLTILALGRDDLDSAFSGIAAIVARTPDAGMRLELFRALTERYPDSAEAQQALAQMAASQGDHEIADTAARRALELRPDWDKPRLFRVRLLLAQDRREAARELLERYIALDPDDPALRLLYGQLLVEARDFATARIVFERLLKQRPGEPDVLFALGILSLQLEDPDRAIAYFTQLRERGERHHDVAFYLGQAEERRGNRTAALDWYARVRGTHAADAQIRSALLHALEGELDRARGLLHRLRESAPDDALALYLIEAEILDQAGDTAGTLAVYETALLAHPDDSELLYARALYAVKQDRLDLAEADLRRILDADPEHADALNALGYTLADRTDRHEEAYRLIKQAYLLKPEEPAILDSMGWVLFRLGDYEGALDYLQRALAMLSDGEIAAHVGEVLWAMGRREEAWAVWDEAIAEHPDHDYLLEVVERHRAVEQHSTGPTP